ncbi:response regulator transcription factor [Arthrobacter sp. MPF02]|uniref:response regulator transcription factor n=1 Tax=Arthrobacter sp. MPF02 TaxID=3388492 RepID=UPI0039853BEF
MSERRVCLVVEDDDDIRGLVKVVLTREGFEVRTARTGIEGVLAAADPELSLITLDLAMPDLDGDLLVKAVRTHTSVPLLVLSARTEENDVFGSLAAGADAYLAKPFRPSELREAVRTLTSGTRITGEAVAGPPGTAGPVAAAGCLSGPAVPA